MAGATIENVTKRYGAVHAMHGVSVDIEDGEFVVLVGPSGCGFMAAPGIHERTP